jgi:hypothetical protein
MALGRGSDRWDDWRDRIWRWTHPRAAPIRDQERDNDHQLYQATVAQVLQENEAWMAIAQKPEASPEELRAVVNQWEARSRRHSGLNLSHVFLRDELNLSGASYCPELQYAICAHPNLPLDVFHNGLEMNQATVGGMLSNPAFPLWLLEKPDFFETLSPGELIMFAGYALKHRELSPALLRLLTIGTTPSLALEAKTHCSALKEMSRPTPLTLAWLDRQIIESMREDPYGPVLLHLLHWHGLMPSVPATALLELVDDTISGTADGVQEWIRRARSIARYGRLFRRQWLHNWSMNNRVLSSIYGGCKANQDLSLKIVNLRAILTHRRLPRSVRNDLYTTLSSRILLHLPLLEQPDVPTWFVRQSYDMARRMVLENFGQSEDGPSFYGAFYLVVRDMPDGIASVQEANPVWPVWRRLPDYPFPVRLAIALRLNDGEPEHCQLRSQLRDDPNVYVRAAARKEITWPE